jgi:hypothetical protein
MSELRDERLAQNEGLFRSINENIEGVALMMGTDAPYEFICECASRDCFERIELTVFEYEQIRKEGTRFVLRPGHEDMEVEQVVATGDGYLVVEKDGVAGLVALADDPRA